MKLRFFFLLVLGAMLFAQWPFPLAAQQASPIRIWIADSVPLPLLNAVNPLFASGDYTWTTQLANADLALDYEQEPGAVTSEWLYAPVLPFPSLAENLRWGDVRRYWQGDLSALAYLTPDDQPPVFVTSNETLRAMVSLLGEPADNVPLHFAETTDSIAALLWENRPHAWGVVGFGDLQPDLKLLRVDGQNLFAPDFNALDYPLSTHINLKGDPNALGQAMEDLRALGTWQPSNRDPLRLTRLGLSGVTALTRATAAQMEAQGITRPADGIMDFIADVDILHTSNEVSFSENCPAPDPFGGVIFCSADAYMELLTHIGLDVVELTGNHINDYGPGAFRRSLEMYSAQGIGTFGGGYDPADARDAYLTTHNGNSIAFIGCNVPGPPGAWAAEGREGAARCDDAFLEEELPRLAAAYDVVIMTVQDYEYYSYSVAAPQLARFQHYAALGADVIIGTQAHQPHGFTLTEGSFMHHGLGNLFFDQMQAIPTRQLFIDKVIIYEGRVISVLLYTGLIEDFCCPRPMTAAERDEFLRTIFQASGW